MNPVEEFSIRVERDGAAPLLRVRGELDMTTAFDLDECIRDLDAKAIRLDLGGVTFMDSSGLAVLERTRKRLDDEGGGLALLNVQPIVRRVFEVTGLDDLFDLDAPHH